MPVVVPRDDTTSDRVLVTDGLTLVLLSLAPLRRAGSRTGPDFPDGGAALLIVDALRRVGASESWLRHVGVGLKTLARVMIHHHRHEFAGDIYPSEKLGWSTCASNLHLLGTAMAFDDAAAATGPHAGPRLPLSMEVATAACQDVSSESVNRMISVVELAYGLAHRIPTGAHYSEVSMAYAADVTACLEAVQSGR